MPEDAIETEAALRRLALLAGSNLAAEWQAQFGTPVPAAVPDSLRRLAIAHALQSGAREPLPKSVKASARVQRRSRRPTGSDLRPGTALVRDWGGRTYRVDVLEDGRLRWDGRSWRSLSAIARAITGTPRSGPAFFGLGDRKGRP